MKKKVLASNKNQQTKFRLNGTKKVQGQTWTQSLVFFKMID